MASGFGAAMTKRDFRRPGDRTPAKLTLPSHGLTAGLLPVKTACRHA